MKTLLTGDIAVAADHLKRSGLVAFPTETVYGLGANAFDEAAIRRIFEAKERPSDNPLIIHIGSIEQVKEIAENLSHTANDLIAEFFPGPLTLVLTRRSSVPDVLSAGLDSIGVRMPADATAHAFLAKCGVPVAAPSANLSGRPSPTTWEAVYEDLNGRIDCILQSEPTLIGLESTVVDCTADLPVILRAGAISLESLRETVPSILVRTADPTGAPKSPGMRHRHYSPNARVVIVRENEKCENSSDGGYIGIDSPSTEFRLSRICNSVDAYAKSVFEFFRECDRSGIKTIYCQAVPETGIGTALMDRLRRAAE